MADPVLVSLLGMSASPTRSDLRRSTTSEQSGPRRLFAALVALTVLFVFLQSLTAGEFISDGLSGAAKHTWTDVHGFVAYPIMVSALAASVVGFARLRASRDAAAWAGALFALSVLQWLLGHCITTLGWDWVTPWHVVLAFVVYGVAVWLLVRAVAMLRD